METRMTDAGARTPEDPKTLDRRQFSLAAALAVLSGVAITISSACSSSNSYMPSSPSPTPTPTPNPTPAATGDKMGVISNNHGHVAIITGAQLTAGNAIQLDIRGSATHTHTVSLSAADIATIAASQQVARQSSTDSGHSHTVTFN
jgi:hypothetical protein